jgi:flagellar basal-body rod modification protein FlgD
MTTPVNSTSPLSSASTNSATSASTASTQTLGQDAFLKLLMAQMQNQDPLQPTDGTQFVTQLAQFTQVQQSVSQSTALGNISTQLQGMSNSNASDLVGKTVTLSGSGSVNWDGTFATTSNVSLSGAAHQLTVTIQDAQGNTVRTLNRADVPAGPLSVTWDGNDDHGQAVPAGTYSVNPVATDASGQPVTVSQSVTGAVTQVSFDKGYPMLTLASGLQGPVSQLVSVGATPATQSASTTK